MPTGCLELSSRVCCNSGFSNSRPVPKSSHSLWASQLGAVGSQRHRFLSQLWATVTSTGQCGSLDMARWMIIDSHQSEPDPVNAIEKVLIHRTAMPRPWLHSGKA